MSPGVSPKVSLKTGVSSGTVEKSVSGTLSGPGLRSVHKVSRECPRSVEKVSQTLQRHFLGTREPGPGDTPWDTPRDTPVFGDTLGDTPGDTSGPKGARDPCSRPGGSILRRYHCQGWMGRRLGAQEVCPTSISCSSRSSATGTGSGIRGRSRPPDHAFALLEVSVGGLNKI